MEDSHISQFNIVEGIHLFGVFDGHGGHEVAMMIKDVYVNELISLEEFKKQEYGAALKRSFMKMDEFMRTEKGRATLKKYAKDEAPANPIFGIKNLDMIANEVGCTACVALIAKG